MEKTLINLFNKLNTKYGGINPEMLDTVLVPRYFEILELNKEVRKRGSAYTVTIKLRVDGDGEGVVRGQTGKILSKEFVESGDYWKELGKARIHRFDDNFAVAELFAKTGSKADLEHSLEIINVGDYMEIDNYGLSANLTSALSELAFSEIANSKGFMIKRMPEDIAKHLMDNDGYYNFDFLIEREGFSKKVEVKSLWGTNTDMARLIHSKTKDYATSSCKFETQDIFAVNLYLRTGKIT
ncbi:MAG: hypothetical protein KAH67_10500, partial [Flavobacteriaceae bacterium]|nr:hypothetical protein [Flavobacteriaceae bacterium]